ncbi:fluoride efflux transporter FluC [Actinokineospora fastidiosa]|uniref:Fluoride-specific ion channel FluC n=1 Tax=Actinokineospora fastidiosa TaxID=1816 RepID=A0A918G6H8_9PSEU|nr:CrcB family protein [Actinokineospora fastidiosa]GGS21791.1 putative fluoride ion transporter CrcB 2 [Actinokineospora fastidiosa]
MSVLLVAIGAAVGAPLRYLADRAFGARFPFGTLLVNVVGSLVLGYLTTLPGGALTTGLGAGFCGALTTYSSFGYQTLWLVERRAIGLAAVNLAANLGLGFGAAYLGMSL